MHKLVRRTSTWAIIGFTLKGTCTLSIMAWSAFMAWSGSHTDNTLLWWHVPLLIAGTLMIGGLCVHRSHRRRQQEFTRSGETHTPRNSA